jgi:micrococcal nuclease
LSSLHEPALTFRVALALALSAACNANARESNPDTPVQRVSPREQAVVQTIKCRVTRISDGDSMQCGTAGRIRLLLIDAPELAQGAAGSNAREALLRILPVGTSVTVETDVRPRDSYKRILGYVYLPDGKMANEEMARTGYATSLVYPPNVRYVERIRRAVDDARKAKRGLWATNFFDCSPRDYRAGRCASSAGAREDRSTPRSRR